ncbi:N-methylhydantoinase A/acetone carboxylase, beta subunit, partial [Candidatus Regiella insecticola 5.15]
MTHRIGIDVGGTNTDAVLLNNDKRVIARTKQSTTGDVITGIEKAI